MRMHTVTVRWGQEVRILEAPEGNDLLSLLAEAEIILSAPCQGNGKCGKCKVTADGKEVLACQTPVLGDLEVEVPHSEGSGLTGSDGRQLSQGGVGLGIALDIGTTTLAAALVDCSTGEVLCTASMLNPQRVWGADVISRIAACGDGKLALLTRLIREAAAELCGKLLPDDGKAAAMTVCGNTTMLHIFCGVDPSPIGVAPYTPVFTDMKALSGEELGLPAEKVYILPSVSGYIGSDVVCGILALEGNCQGDWLLADLGTNGELALIRDGKIFCASTAAGPALEGANIECGTGGVSGAVCAVDRTGNSLSMKTVSDAEPSGICGSGLTDLMAVLLRCCLIDETGAFDEECGDPLAEKLDDRQYWITDSLWLSQKDVRQFQLAKAAIHAGIETLCESADTSADRLSRVYVAGGLGFYLREESILETGLIPRGAAGKLQAPGNTALGGAILCLRSQERERAAAIAREARVCELSCRPDFSQRFIDAMCFE